MHKRQVSLFLFLLAAFTAWTAAALGQEQAMLTFNVKTPEGVAVQNADVSLQPAQPPTSVRANVQGRPVTKFGLQAQPYRPFFVAKTNADGRVQVPKAGFEKALPADKIVVTVRAAGYQPYRQTFELADQKPVEIVLRPLPPQ